MEDILVPADVILTKAKSILENQRETEWEDLLVELEEEFGSASVSVIRDNLKALCGGKPKRALEEPEQKESKKTKEAVHIKLSEGKYVSSSWYNGKQLLDIRAYYTDSEGNERPTKKGISLNAEQWSKLSQCATDIASKLEQGSTATYDLSSNRKVSVREYKNTLLVDIREYYESPSGTMEPGKKGISLTADQWKVLLENMQDIKALMDKPSAPADISSAKPEPSKGVTTGADGDKFKLELNATRFLKVRTYRNTILVDLREYYSKDGVMCPGKKGVSLNLNQWNKLNASMESINNALQMKDSGYALELSNNKRVTISNYKGAFLLDIREWYNKDEKVLPTKKGISLSPDQWQRISDNISEITTVLK